MKRKLYVLLVITGIVSAFAETPSGQAKLESWLEGIVVDDYFPEGEPPYVPLRNRDALTEFRDFFVETGWTTNQFIEGLIFAATNNMTEVNWASSEKEIIARRAIGTLAEINNPVVTNFFRLFIESGEYIDKVKPISCMFTYTNLEPEVLSYMRTLCVKTNVYDRMAGTVMLRMFETLSTMPDSMKPAATNRVAQYMYFAIHHVTDSQGWQDIELSRFIPAYSNSIQRLRLMQYVANSATNAWERSNAASVVQALSAIPTNQLNDVSWITE